MKIFTAPQHTRFILPLTSPDKIIAALRGRYFSLWELGFPGQIPQKPKKLLHARGMQQNGTQNIIGLRHRRRRARRSAACGT